MRKRIIHLYGDNVVECERAFDLIDQALDLENIQIKGKLTNLEITASTSNTDYEFVFFPGFRRWEYDVLEHVKDRGGVLREAPDCVITEVLESGEKVMLGIEFCSALPAGNQAWQRSGRAYSFARAGYPYIYLTEIGGYELNAKREKKASRMPNPAVPFSYVSYSNTKDTPVLVVFQFSPGADNINKERYKEVVSNRELLEFIRQTLLNLDLSSAEKQLESSVLNFVSGLAENSRSKKGVLTPTEWTSLYTQLQSTNDVLGVLAGLRKIAWSKKASIPRTDSAKSLMQLGSKFGQGITSKDLPICFISKANAKMFLSELISIYPDLNSKIKNMFNGGEDVAICWINGFKPRGDDARPDRGLLPLLRMLIGDSAAVLTVLFGPAKPFMWDLLEKNPNELAVRNGLWETILWLSDGLIVDSCTLENSDYISKHHGDWPTIQVEEETPELMNVNSKRKPVSLGENDVDSALHILFEHLLSEQTFESMCNPPGGDWSGVSVISCDKEYRWLTLPRVSASGSKRPDHIIQILDGDELLCVESKDLFRNLEPGIGPRLNQYCNELLSTPPSCKRNKNSGIEGWSDEVSEYVAPNFNYVSVAAFLKTQDSDLENAAAKAGCSVIFSITFDVQNNCMMEVMQVDERSDQLIALLKKLSVPANIGFELNFIEN